MTLAETRGSVRVRPPGSTAFVALGELASLPVGTVVNASHGKVELESALSDGTTQTGSFHGSRFHTRQNAEGKGLINLHLRGGNLGCGAGAGISAMTSAAAKPKRRLWGSDSGGRFRTHGRDSVATVRGTRWNVTDRCDGTLTRVHVVRMSSLSHRLALAIGMPATDAETLRHAAMLHDVGKVGVPDRLLLSPAASKPRGGRRWSATR